MSIQSKILASRLLQFEFIMLYLFKVRLEEILTKCGWATVTTVHEVVLVCVDKTEKSPHLFS